MLPSSSPLAVITGASRGIGLALARQFAERNFDLLLTAEEDAVREVAEDLRRDGHQVDALVADLTTYAGVEMLSSAITALGRPVSAAVLNAGTAAGGAFLDTELQDELTIIDLNVTSVVHLTKRLLPAMVAAGSGRLMITSSIAATMPGSHLAVYNASKSFVQSFGAAVQDELRGTPVSLTLLMPGPTETSLFQRAGMSDTRVGRMHKDDPAEVARQGFEAMMSGRRKVVAESLATKTLAKLNAVLPDSIKAAAHRVIAEPGKK